MKFREFNNIYAQYVVDLSNLDLQTSEWIEDQEIGYDFIDELRKKFFSLRMRENPNVNELDVDIEFCDVEEKIEAAVDNALYEIEHPGIKLDLKPWISYKDVDDIREIEKNTVLVPIENIDGEIEWRYVYIPQKEEDSDN